MSKDQKKEEKRQAENPEATAPCGSVAGPGSVPLPLKGLEEAQAVLATLWAGGDLSHALRMQAGNVIAALTYEMEATAKHLEEGRLYNLDFEGWDREGSIRTAFEESPTSLSDRARNAVSVYEVNVLLAKEDHDLCKKHLAAAFDLICRSRSLLQSAQGKCKWEEFDQWEADRKQTIEGLGDWIEEYLEGPSDEGEE